MRHHRPDHGVLRQPTITRRTVSRLSGGGAVLALVGLIAAGCDDSGPTTTSPVSSAPTAKPSGTRPLGRASTPPKSRAVTPVATLDRSAHPDFFAGQALARQPWVKAPTTTTARDGLGPLYNARACFSCHPNAGRGALPETAEQAVSQALVRLSVPGDPNAVAGVLPEPRYGAQLQPRSTSLASFLGRKPDPERDVVAEAKLTIRWSSETFRYPDGTEVELRRPTPRLTDLAYGPLAAGTMQSLRNASPLYGLGLIDAIPQASLDQLADPDDRNGDGVSGRVNLVWDRTEKKLLPGRFGHKANQTTLRQQVAAAFAGDIGISNPLFPDQPCTAHQTRCRQAPHGNDAETGVELSDALLDSVVDFVRHLGIRTRTAANDVQVLRGQAAFEEVGCGSCHHPNFKTSSEAYPHLDGLEIWPYTDLLLHDMGPALADGRPDYQASGSEWRTPPLWAADQNVPRRAKKKPLNRALLHDARARTHEEAILWHGGEAERSRDAFAALPAPRRADLVRFLESL